jgi:protein-S-isoprenylcysteine O-methyltransferase Ste14
MAVLLSRSHCFRRAAEAALRPCETGLTVANLGRTMAAVNKLVAPLLKTAVFTVLVPGTVAGIVPWLLRETSVVQVGGGPRWAAFTVVALGIAIYLHTAFWGFAVIGGGTPAPIAPPKTLVVEGLHRFVRNPMYIGVLLIVAGQVWLFWSRSLCLYLLLLWLAFHLFVMTYEEPTLRKQFGESYERYRATVPRWIPKFRL